MRKYPLGPKEPSGYVIKVGVVVGVGFGVEVSVGVGDREGIGVDVRDWFSSR